MKTPFPAMKCLQKVLKSRIKKCLRHRVKVNRKNFDRGETGTVNDPDIYFKGQKKGFGTVLVPSSWRITARKAAALYPRRGKFVVVFHSVLKQACA